MPSAPIPFGNALASGLEELGGASPVAMNVISEPGGVVRRRPGLASFVSTVVNAQGVSGLYETVSGALYAVGGTIPTRNIYRVTVAGGANLSAVPQGDLRGTLRPTFAETEALLVIAGGEDPQKVVLATDTPSRLGGSPPFGSHVVANASRLLLNDVVTLRGSINFSSPSSGSSYTGHEQWNGVASVLGSNGLVSAESRPDGVVALGERTNEVFAWGPTSVQSFAPDNQFVYAPVSADEHGTSAPYSIVAVDTSFAWLDHLRRFVLGDARQQTVFSDPIQTVLDSMTTVSDCFGYRVKLGPHDLLVWSFPTDGRTFCFQKGSGWSQWAKWNAQWEAFPVTCKTDLRIAGGVAVGTTDGRVAKLSLTADDLGTPIWAYVETGFQNRGTDALKRCKGVTVALRRGSSDSEPIGRLQWRDELGPWCAPVEVGFGAPADQQVVLSFRGLGSYRRRQWRFEFGGTGDFSLVSVTEDFTIAE